MKAIIIGLNNPISPRPDDALLPYPAGCTGHRLLELLQLADPSFDEADYLETFERRNLWRGMELPIGRGKTALLRREGRRLLDYCTAEPREVVLLGAQVWSAVTNRTAPSWLQSKTIADSVFWYVPHPSGLNRIYNKIDKRADAGRLLLEVARRTRTFTPLRIVGGTN